MKIQLLAVACMIPVAAYAAVGSSGNNQRSSINDIVSKVNSLKSGHDSDSRSRWDSITHEDDRIVSDVQDGFTQINQVINTNLTTSDAKIQQALQDAYNYSDQKDADNKAEIEATTKLLAQIEDRALKNDLEDYIDSEIEKAKINGGGSGGGSSTPVTKNFTKTTKWPERDSDKTKTRIYSMNINTGLNLSSVSVKSIGWNNSWHAERSFYRDRVNCSVKISNSNHKVAVVSCNAFSHSRYPRDRYAGTTHYNLVDSVTISATGTP